MGYLGGAGQLNVTGTNSYTGGTILAGGTLNVVSGVDDNNRPLGTGTLDLCVRHGQHLHDHVVGQLDHHQPGS